MGVNDLGVDAERLFLADYSLSASGLPGNPR
jgi:hypothetical protein